MKEIIHELLFCCFSCAIARQYNDAYILPKEDHISDEKFVANSPLEEAWKYQYYRNYKYRCKVRNY